MNKTEKSDFQNLATTIIGVVLFTSLMAIPFGEVAGVAYKASFQTLLGLNVVIWAGVAFKLSGRYCFQQRGYVFRQHSMHSKFSSFQ